MGLDHLETQSIVNSSGLQPKQLEIALFENIRYCALGLCRCARLCDN